MGQSAHNNNRTHRLRPETGAGMICTETKHSATSTRHLLLIAKDNSTYSMTSIDSQQVVESSCDLFSVFSFICSVYFAPCRDVSIDWRLEFIILFLLHSYGNYANNLSRLFVSP